MGQSLAGSSPKQPVGDGSPEPVGAWKDGVSFPRTKAGYREFLKTDFWRNLTALKLRLNPLCQIPECRHGHATDSHHVFYRRNWFETLLSDLLSVCATHHRQIHGFSEPVPVTPAVVPPKQKRVLRVLRRKRDRFYRQFKNGIIVKTTKAGNVHGYRKVAPQMTEARQLIRVIEQRLRKSTVIFTPNPDYRPPPAKPQEKQETRIKTLNRQKRNRRKREADWKSKINKGLL